MFMVAPCHVAHSQAPTPGVVFSSDMICEAIIDRIVELLKLTNSGKVYILLYVKVCVILNAYI